ncbi:MAG: hypothetical protein DRQ55_10305 [Planctomycetota bacterium]|nr:MAG: hypothetical protein DRQ55_10305 [Planctomycetota bacterium]
MSAAADREALLETLFHRALGVGESERDTLLERACPEDPALRAEVHELLAAHAEAPSCLEHASRCVQVLGEPGLSALGERLGPYELVGLLGEGGMGSVYRAQQSEPFERQVALKLIKPGMDTREVLDRFASERQLLARLTHAHIAAVFDAGVTPMGRPYFVMELVDGAPITRFLDRRRAPLEERLRLFATVCGAVQHAHQKGVLHRDLKPGNVLVTDNGGAPMPKVIDFGVAKALEGDARRDTLRTRQGQLIGTPGYMSPEQAGTDGAVVDTRSDVYSLGVMLYELLTGVLPVDVSGLAGAGDTAVRQRLSEAAPLTPSARLEALGPAARRRRAGRRGCDPTSLQRALRGDLDAIVMKAIARDPTARYATASELAADVLAHLGGDPVSAGPPAVPFRLARLVARHRVSAAAVLLLGLALMSGPSMLALSQSERLAGLEKLLVERDGPEAPPPRAPLPPVSSLDPSCADCSSARLVNRPLDTVFVRNVSRRLLSPGDVLELVGESSHDGLAIFDVAPSRAGSSRALLGVVLRAVELDAGHLHDQLGGLRPGALGQAVARGSLVSVRVDGPVAAHASLGLASLSGSAAAHHGGPVLGTVQRGWRGPGPGRVRATVEPKWLVPSTSSEQVLSRGGVALAAPAVVESSLVPRSSRDVAGEPSGSGDDSWGSQNELSDPKLFRSESVATRRTIALRPGPRQGMQRSTELALAQAKLDDLALRDNKRGTSGSAGGDEELPPGADQGELAVDEQAQVGPRFVWLDHDSDGLDDLLLLNAGRLTLLANLGQGQFEDRTERLELDSDWLVAELVDADIDLDGRTDLVLLGRDGSLRLLRASGAQRLVDATAGSGLQALSSGRGLVSVDTDADGWTDLLLTLADDSVVLLLNVGGASFLALPLPLSGEDADDGGGLGSSLDFGSDPTPTLPAAQG